MSTQIFKRNIPNEILFNLLESICMKTTQYYIYNVEAFKVGLFKEIIPKFIEDCRPYYHLSKKIYLDKKLTFNSFTTILRQICNFNKIKYVSQIKYDKSKYNIIYFIYKDV
jgi:hypothetical protein